MKYQLINKNEDTIVNIFGNRGVNPYAMLALDESCLYSPFLIKNMEEAVDVVHTEATKDDDGKILIVIDSDADGLCSSSIMYMYLTDCYPSLAERLELIGHPGKQHGIPLDEVYKREKVSLVIAPDCSSGEEAIHKELSEKGIPVVVLDHHDAEKYSEYATMVNISLDDYPNKNLAGGHVVYKFCKAYDIKFGFQYADNYLDLAMVASLADMIQINTEETVYLIQQGLQNIKTAFMQSMVKVKSYNLGTELTPTGIVFYVSPLLNAAVRVGTQEEKDMLIKAMTTKTFKEVPSTKRGAKPGDTEIIQEQAVRVLGNIKSRQGRQVDKAMEELRNQIRESQLDSNQVIVLDSKKKFPSEFNGLIANKFLQEYKKPILVGSEWEMNGKTVFSGSARGDDKSTLADLRSFMNESNRVIYAEGHASAFGFSAESAEMPNLVEYFNKKLKDLVFEPVYDLDFIIDFKDLDISRLEEITRYASYWARGMEEPKFMIQNIPVMKGDIEIAGNFGNQRVNFSSKGVKFISFGRTLEEVKALKKNTRTELDIIGSVSMSNFPGNEGLQIIVDDFEIKKAQEYYF